MTEHDEEQEDCMRLLLSIAAKRKLYDEIIWGTMEGFEGNARSISVVLYPQALDDPEMSSGLLALRAGVPIEDLIA